MRRIFVFICMIIGINNIFALDEISVRKWLKEDFNLSEVIISNTKTKFNDSDLYIAYHKILSPTDSDYYGMFDRATIFYQSNELFIPVVYFNGPVVINPNGNRVFDFSGQEYDYLNFFGWEIEFRDSKKYRNSVVISLRQNLGKNVADSIGMYFDEFYNQFVVNRSPFDPYILLDVDEPKIIGLARKGYDSTNEFENSVDVFLDNLSIDELRLCRNAIYAIHGYRLNDVKLIQYFYQYNWYKPGTKEENDKIELTADQESLKQLILKREAK